MKVLVIGAGGVFGRHLVQGLLRADFDVALAGRSLDRLNRLRHELAADFPAASLAVVVLDTKTLTAADLLASGAGIVADAAGPFQGAEPTVARAAIDAGLHYVDLADGRDFVAAFPQLDTQARAAGVVALTGCSSTPALSQAVLDELTQGWQGVHAVEVAISPGARAPRGLSVMQAILTWLGRPVRVFIDGRWQVRRGWSGLFVRDCGPAGRRWLSLCETPDLDLIVERQKPRDRALFLAGLEPWPLHLGAWVLAGLAAVSGHSARPLARPLLALARPFAAFGSDRGTLRVEASGLDAQGRPVREVWLLVAPPGVGPVTPSLPALVAIRTIVAGGAAPGAGACVGVLPLAALEAELSAHGMQIVRNRLSPEL